MLVNMGPEWKAEVSWGNLQGKHLPLRADVFEMSGPCPVSTWLTPALQMPDHHI